MTVNERTSTLVPVQVQDSSQIRYRGMTEDKFRRDGDFQVFDVTFPDNIETHKVERLAKGDLMGAIVHHMKAGGETNLHAHSAQDATWIVIQGRVNFYGEGDRQVASIGPGEGIFIPRGTPYWFENSGNEATSVVRVSSRVESAKDLRLDYTPRKSEF